MPSTTPHATTATVAQHLAHAQSLLGAWLDALTLAPRDPIFFSQNIHALNEATGILCRLAAIDKTLAALRYRDRTDGRMLKELNFLLDKILRITKSKPLIAKHAHRATPLPPMPAFTHNATPTTHVDCGSSLPPETSGACSAHEASSTSQVSATTHPPFPEASLLDTPIQPTPELATAITTAAAATHTSSVSVSASPCPSVPQLAPTATRHFLLSAIRACRLPSGCCNDLLRPHLLSYLTHALNAFCDRMDDRYALQQREGARRAPDTPRGTQVSASTQLRRSDSSVVTPAKESLSSVGAASATPTPQPELAIPPPLTAFG